LSDLKIDLSSSTNQDENRLAQILKHEKNFVRNAAAMFDGKKSF